MGDYYPVNGSPVTRGTIIRNSYRHNEIGEEYSGGRYIKSLRRTWIIIKITHSVEIIWLNSVNLGLL